MAETNGLLNRRTDTSVPRVRIPPSPPNHIDFIDIFSRRRVSSHNRSPIARPLAASVVNSEPNIRNKLSGGKFTAVLLVQCLEAIGSSSLRLDYAFQSLLPPSLAARIDAAGDRAGAARAAGDTGGRRKLALRGAGQEPFAARRLAQVSKIDLAGLDAGRAQPNSSRIAVAEPMAALVLKGAEHSRGYAL